MSLARAARGAFLCVLPFACGERAGDAVIALPTPSTSADAGSAGTSSGAAGPDDDGGAAGQSPSPSESQPSGLCAPCTASSECGDANDACLRHEAQSFCGRDCNEQRDCPDGYDCAELSNSRLWQCVPESTCPAPSPPAPSLAELRAYVLARINAERTALDRMPLDASSCLNQLAQASALDFARTDEPLGNFEDECAPIWPSCACDWWAQAEITVARYGLDWTTAVETALGSYRNPESERFVQAFTSDEVRDVGIGFWLSGDEAWLALSFR